MTVPLRGSGRDDLERNGWVLAPIAENVLIGKIFNNTQPTHLHLVIRRVGVEFLRNENVVLLT